MDKHLSMLVLALATTFLSVRAQGTFKEAIPNNPFKEGGLFNKPVATQTPFHKVLQKVTSMPLPPWKGSPTSEYTSECQALEVSPNGAFLAVAGDAPVIQIYTTATDDPWSLFMELKVDTESKKGLLFDNVFWSADGSLLVASTYCGSIYLWSTLTWKPVRSAEVTEMINRGKPLDMVVRPHSMSIALSPDSKTLAVASQYFASEQDKTEGKPDFENSSLYFFDFKTFDLKQKVKLTVNSFAWAPDGTKVVLALWNTGSDALSNHLQVLEPKTQTVKGVAVTTWLLLDKKIPYYGSMAHRLSFNSDSSLLAAGLQSISNVPASPSVLLFKITGHLTGNSWEKVQLLGHMSDSDSSINAPALGDSHSIMAIKFSPNGRALAIMDTWQLVVAELDGELANLPQTGRLLQASSNFVQTQVMDFTASVERSAAVVWTNDGKNLLAGVNSFVEVFTVPTTPTPAPTAAPNPCATEIPSAANNRLFASEKTGGKPATAAALALRLSGGWLTTIAAFALGVFVMRVVAARRSARRSRSIYMEPGQLAAPACHQSLASFTADAEEDANATLAEDIELAALISDDESTR